VTWEVVPGVSSSIGVPTGTQTTINGTLTYRVKYDAGGNTRWILGIDKGDGTPILEVLARQETLTTSDISKIDRLAIPGFISVVVDSSNTVIRVN